jgi:tryptophanase
MLERLLVIGPGGPRAPHVDTTRANGEPTGRHPVDLPCPQARGLDSDELFKGNIDLHRLEEALRGPDASRSPWSSWR